MAVMTDDEVLLRILDVMRDTLKGGKQIVSISRDSTANTVPGWDSLSHAVLILNIESEFDVELPIEETLELNNVGDLADLIKNSLQKKGQA